jgi:PIN domain nuclease of toxin-antitoxin system
LLLDTHAFLWWMMDHRSLSRSARVAMENQSNEVFISAATAWEITTKHRLGKLDEAGIVAADVASAIAEEGFLPLAITVAHGQRAGELSAGDPFDRMLIAQTMLEKLTLVSNETGFDSYRIKRLW